MTKPVFRIALRYGLAALLAGVILTGLLALRLFMGPVSLTPLTPFFEARFNEELRAHSLKIGDTILRWSPGARKADLRLLGVHLYDEGGREIAAIPAVDIGLSAAALSRGYFVPERIEVVGPSATLIRRAGTGIQLGFTPSDQKDVAEGSASFFSALADELGRPAEKGDHLRFLRTFLIRDASMTFFDSETGTLWRAPKAELALSRSRNGLLARLDAHVGLVPDHLATKPPESFSVRADVVLPYRSKIAYVTADLSDLNPARVTADTPGLTKLAGIDLDLSGKATLSVSTVGRVEEATFSLHAGRGRFEMPGFSSLALAVNQAEVEGRFDGAADRIVLDRVAYDAGRNRGALKGTVTLQRDAQRHVQSIALDLRAKQIAVDLPKVFAEPSQIDELTFRGEMTFASAHLAVERAFLKIGPGEVDVAGTIDDAPVSPAMNLTGTVKTLPATVFAKLWPIGPALGAHDWLVANIHQGRIDSGTLKIALPAGAAALDELPDEALDVAFSFSGVEASYLNGLTPITAARGYAHLQGNRFELAVDDARVGDLVATKGKFTDSDIAEHGHKADIEAHLAGPASALLAVLNQEPLGYPRRYGIDPKTVGGEVDGVVSARIPLLRAVTVADVNVGAEVTLDHAKIPSLYRDFGLDDGTVHFSVTEKGLSAQGKVVVAGTPATMAWTERFVAGQGPSTAISLAATLDSMARARLLALSGKYLSGPTPVTLELKGQGKSIERVDALADLKAAEVRIPELNWIKPANQAGRVSLQIDATAPHVLALKHIEAHASDLTVKGNVTLAENGKLISAAFDPMTVGRGTKIKLDVRRTVSKTTPRDRLAITISGSALDASELVRELRTSFDADDDPAKPDLAVDGQVKRLGLANGVSMTDAHIRYGTRNLKTTDLWASGLLNGNSRAELSLALDKDKQRLLRMRSSDGGALFSGLALFDQMVGGNLALDLTLPALDRPALAPPAGRLDVTNFRLQRASVLAQLLSVASFTGMRDLLNGEGIAFETLSVPFRIEDDRFVVSDGRAYGPAIGLTLEGGIPRGNGSYNLSGTLVPAYTLNTLLGYVPMLGNLFVSRSGEGVIGMTYAISGDSANPTVTVNALSALAPGFLRRLFQIGDVSAAPAKSHTPAAGAAVPE